MIKIFTQVVQKTGHTHRKPNTNSENWQFQTPNNLAKASNDKLGLSERIAKIICGNSR